MNSRSLQTGLVVALLSCFMIAGTAVADELAEQARELVENYKDAVVTIKLVIENRFSMQGSGSQSEESKSEITGTVIDPSGLVVASLFTTDPTSATRNMMGIDDVGFKMETEIKSADILAPDGEEIAAEVVLRDKDLDLAFLRPKEKSEKPFTALDLSKAGTAAQLEPVVAISRLGRVANRTHGALVDRIEAIVDKPRRFYVPAGGGMTQGSLGAPLFTLDGNVVGILVIRSIRASGGGMMGMMGMMMGMMGGSGDNTLMIAMPAADVLEVAKQAPEHAPEPPKESTEETQPEGEAETEG
jgi:S1-C subfamily serine protease